MKNFYFIYISFQYISREKIEEIGHNLNALKVPKFFTSTPNTYKKTSNGPNLSEISLVIFFSTNKTVKKMANGSFSMKVFLFFLNE